MDINKKILKIRNNYKHADLLLELLLENYHSFNIYIRLDYYKKDKVYKLSWIDFTNDINDNMISYEYIPSNIVKQICDSFKQLKIKKYDKVVNDDFKVTININIENQQGYYLFNRYIPKELNILLNIMLLLFDSLPKKLDAFMQQLGALIAGNTAKYEYREAFNFDLFNGDINSLFENQILERGKKYFEEGRVFFLEKIKDSYIGIVGGQGLYVIILNYDEDTKVMKMYCSCPCEYYCKHMCAAILAIRNNRFRKFYKIVPNDKNRELFDRIMNFNFLLTIGIDDGGNNYLVIEDGLIKLLPVLNNKGKSDWTILEDDRKNTLTKRLNEIIKQ